jgi:hypothetical protein
MVRSAFSSICSCLLLFFLSVSAAQAQSSGKILAHSYLGSFPSGAETLVSVDPGTGTVTPLGSGVPNSGSISLPFVPLSALDSAGHRYFFPDASSILHELDSQTGAEVAAVALSMQPFLAALKFDASSGKLFGHASVGGAEALLSIDPASGNVSTVGTVPNSGSLAAQPAMAALDSAGHRYFFLDYTPVLYALNTQTGAQIAALPLSMALFPAAMEFDPSTGKLFCHTYLGSFPTGAETLLTIDPANGNVASVGAWPNSGSLFDQLGMGALDSASHRYFFLDSSSTLQQMNTQTGVAGTGTALSILIFPSGMEFALTLSSPPPPPPPPPPPDPSAAHIQPPIKADGSSTFDTWRGSVPVKFTLTVNGAATCTLPPATISLTRTAGATTGTVDPALYLQPSDNGTNFRISDCQYVYNLRSRGLGPGTYEVDIAIAGTVVGKGTFKLERREAEDRRDKESSEKEDDDEGRPRR